MSSKSTQLRSRLRTRSTSGSGSLIGMLILAIIGLGLFIWVAVMQYLEFNHYAGKDNTPSVWDAATPPP